MNLISKYLLLVILALSLNGFTIEPYAGIAMNGSVTQTSTQVKSESPLGVFGVLAKTEYISGGYRHISSIPQIDETQGINELLVRVNYKWFYTGIAYNDKMTSSYYTEQISKYSRLAGIELDYGDKYIFIEYRDSSIQDMVMYGVGLRFDTKNLKW